MTRESYVAAVRRRLLRMVNAGQVVSSAQAAAGIPKPEGIECRCLGPMVNALKAAGLIVFAGYSTSETKSHHHGLVRLWRSPNSKKDPDAK